MNTFINSLSNTTFTENEALTNISTKSALLDLFFHSGAMRKDNSDRLYELFEKAFNEDKTKTLRIMFYIRDVRGGQGERETFRRLLSWLAQNESKWIKDNLNLIPEYGRWDDFSALLENDNTKNEVIEFLYNQYKKDLEYIDNNQLSKISLLGKWLWSENASKKETIKYARILIKSGKFGIVKDYRKNLVKLRKAINIVETKLCNKEYKDIDYSQLPSLALLKYRSAFYRNDEEKYKKYLEDVNKGEAKINTKTLYPYDIIRGYKAYFKYNKGEVKIDETLETQWKNLPDYVPAFNGLVVYDTSGSMDGLPMFISTSLAIYIAERNKSEVWKNYVIPFSSESRFIKIKGETLLEKLKSVFTGDCSNTNLQGVFDLILERAKACNVKKEDMPESLIIISDMEFDEVDNSKYQTNYEAIKEKYKESGYELPRIIWWNVDSRNTQSPVTVDDMNNVLISGCSPVALKLALNPNGSAIEIINEIINSERYKQIVYE